MLMGDKGIGTCQNLQGQRLEVIGRQLRNGGEELRFRIIDYLYAIVIPTTASVNNKPRTKTIPMTVVSLSGW